MDTHPWSLSGGPDGWVLTDGLGGQVRLALAPGALAARHWPSGRPDALALERAIDEVEAAIERTPLRHAPRGVLRLSGPGLATPDRMGLPLGTWPREALEQAFSRQLAVPVPALSGEAAASLLMLRELMHHLGFSQLDFLN